MKGTSLSSTFWSHPGHVVLDYIQGLNLHPIALKGKVCGPLGGTSRLCQVREISCDRGERGNISVEREEERWGTQDHLDMKSALAGFHSHPGWRNGVKADLE